MGLDGVVKSGARQGFDGVGLGRWSERIRELEGEFDAQGQGDEQEGEWLSVVAGEEAPSGDTAEMAGDDRRRTEETRERDRDETGGTKAKSKGRAAEAGQHTYRSFRRFRRGPQYEGDRCRKVTAGNFRFAEVRSM